MGGIFAQLDAWVTALMLAALMLGAWRIGLWNGKKQREQGVEAESDKFEEAAMALVGLLLAFTFSMAIAKHDRRREMLVADSNAIGDFYTCASLLKDPVKTGLQGCLRDYTGLRLAVARGQGGPLDEALRKFEQSHGRMTELVGQALNEGTPIAVPLTNTLNGVTSSHAARLAAIRDRLPASIVWLLYFSSTVSTLLMGRRQGAAGKAKLAGVLSYVLLVTLVVYVTLDLNQPGRGLITVSQEPLERLLASMGK